MTNSTAATAMQSPKILYQAVENILFASDSITEGIETVLFSARATGALNCRLFCCRRTVWFRKRCDLRATMQHTCERKYREISVRNQHRSQFNGDRVIERIQCISTDRRTIEERVKRVVMYGCMVLYWIRTVKLLGDYPECPEKRPLAFHQ